MSTTQLTVFDPHDLAARRDKALRELEEELMTFARTAPEPADRSVQAELAEEVRNLRIRWQIKGLIALPEGAGREAAQAA
jgi:hypothetical protein